MTSDEVISCITKAGKGYVYQYMAEPLIELANAGHSVVAIIFNRSVAFISLIPVNILHTIESIIRLVLGLLIGIITLPFQGCIANKNIGEATSLSCLFNGFFGFLISFILIENMGRIVTGNPVQRLNL